MRFQFATDQLTALFTTGRANGCITATAIDAFFEAMAIIVAAAEERDVYVLALVRAAPHPKDCMVIHLQGDLYLLTRFFHDEKGSCVEIIDVIEQN